MSASYRVRQFVRAAGAWFQPQKTDEVRRYLPPGALDLFLSMPRYDRQHALNVLHTLQERGHNNPDLLAAALIHDVGKTVQQDGAEGTKGAGALRLGHRVAVVLMRALWPGLLERIGQDRAGSWQQPFYVQQHHAAISADLAQQAGCSPRTVALIQRHEDQPDEADAPLLVALRAADNVN
jgi:hypothetical protein